MGIILAILVFGFVVFFHELGHFLLAKKNDILVEEFCIGMGPKLWGFQKGETEYALRLLPIGGACMMGEDDIETEDKRGFNNKSVWTRMAVIVAGPVFNFILAFLFSVIVISYTGYDAPVAGQIVSGSAAEEAGLQEGDLIKKINGERMHLFREISFYNQIHQGETAEITYERDGKTHTATLEPKQDAETGVYYMGIGVSAYQDGNMLENVKYGWHLMNYWIGSTIDSLKMLVTGQVGMDSLAGPVGIVNVVQDVYQEASPGGALLVALNMINFMTLLSANLGVMNLLPIPALDGGRLVFLIVEAIRGKRIPPEKEGIVHMAGFALLMVLMVFTFYNDITRIFF